MYNFFLADQKKTFFERLNNIYSLTPEPTFKLHRTT